MWIVPAPAQVHADGGKLYILEAPLDVKMETDDLNLPAGQQSVDSCPQQDAATDTHHEALFRNTTYGDLIDQGDIGAWTTKTDWEPTDTFDSYVRSYTKGEYRTTREETRGNSVYKVTYTYGGVDLTGVPLQQVHDDTLMDKEVAASLTTPPAQSAAGAGSDAIWLGSPTPRQSADGVSVSLWSRISTYAGGRNGLFVILFVALGIMMFLIRDSSPLRRKSSD